MKGNILILDDNKSVLTALEMLVQTEFDRVFPLSNPNVLLTTLQQQNIDVVLLDMNFKAGINTGNEGIFWLNQIQKQDPSIVVVMITAYGDVELAVKAVKEGAFDFILKPWDNHKLLSTLHAAMKLRKSQMDNNALAKTARTLKQAFRPPAQELIGQSEPMKNVMTVVKKVAGTDANILIVGENGTGKELIAREIHQHSLRKNEIMVNVDMGAITETLFESELFGHTKGAFTDAKDDRAGKFEAAHKGTLFLDEIGNLPLALQAKLLVVLQSRNIIKVGSNKPIPVDIRLITATNKDLPKMIAGGLFREDLLYRINTITIEVPPLRERGNDVVLLAEFYLEKYSMKYNKPRLKLTPKAAGKLLRHSWPGNVRELQHSIEKAVILADSDQLTEECFVLQAAKPAASHLHNKTIEEMEKEMIQAAIQKENGNMSAVAKKLGISRPTLYKKLKSFEE
ncbi:MAG: sigma-54-dependent Fis family transcriptional regulator [Bacteroidales bacterium]|nr:sigma-54-dependent Fis family transcriptional regulator [Bacteroidales bacterium]